MPLWLVANIALKLSQKINFFVKYYIIIYLNLK